MPVPLLNLPKGGSLLCLPVSRFPFVPELRRERHELPVLQPAPSVVGGQNQAGGGAGRGQRRAAHERSREQPEVR